MENKKYLMRLVWGATLAIAFAGCSGENAEVGGLPGTTTTTGTTDTCTTSVVDRGIKGIVAGTQRGLYSDTRVNPVTGYPAIAYTDSASGAANGNMTVNFSYWDGSKYVHEIVAGEGVGAAAGSAQMIRLAFLSDGKPLIYWTTASTTVKMAARSVSLSSTSTATWSMGVIDTLAAATTGAIEVSVNPLDQVAIIYMHTQAATARPRSILCYTDCSSRSNYSPMNAATDFIDSVSTATMNSVGVAWCKISSTTYYPATTYYGGGNFLSYAICNSATSTGCGVAGNWLKLLTGIASGAVAQDAKLYINPNTTGALPQIIARATGGGALTPYVVQQACNMPPTSLSAAGTALTGSAATTGNAWAQFTVDSNGYAHIMANQSTTSVTYFNSTLPNTLLTTGWNATTVDTQTLPAAFAGSGGGAVNTAGTQAYLSYGGTAAPFNLAQGIMSYTAGGAPVVGTIYPNMSGSVQSPTIANFSARNNAMTSTASGIPGVAYVDYSPAGALGVSARLKYAYRNSTSASANWLVNLVPGTGSPSFPSLVYDSNNLPWISYYDDTTFGTQKRYYLTTNSRTDGTGTWSTYVFPYYAKTTLAAMPAADETTLALSYVNGVAYPVMIIANSHTVSTGLRAARLNPSTGNWTAVQLVDALGASGLQRLTADWDTSGNIVIQWYDLTLTRLRYAYATSTSTAVTFNGVTTLTAATQGMGGSIKMDGSGIPGIAFYNKAGGLVNFMKCTASSAANCANAAAWVTITQVNPVGSSVGVQNLGANSDLLLGTGISYDSSNYPTVYYASGKDATTSVGFLKSVASNTAGTSWTQSVVQAAANGDIGSNTAAHASNFALAGWSPSVNTTSRSTTAMSYIGPGNWLTVTSCGD